MQNKRVTSDKLYVNKYQVLTHNNTMGEYHLKTLSLNVRGMRKKIKRLSIFEYIKGKNVDISFLQESHCTESDEDEWKDEWGGDIIYSNGTNNSRGVLILFKRGLDIKLEKSCKDDDGRLIYLHVIYQNTSFHLFNIYAPVLEYSKKHFYLRLKSTMSRLLNLEETTNIILGGDLNLIFDPSMDRKGGHFCDSITYRETIHIVDDIINSFNLTDIWRKLNPNIKRFTWRRNNPSIHSRLDIWLISDHLQDYVKDTSIKQSVRSDHSAILLYLNSFSCDKGRGYWKLNNSFVQEDDYIKLINSQYTDWKDECKDFTDHRVRWEYMKFKIKSASIIYGQQKAKTNKQREKDLNDKLDDLTNKIEMGNNTKEYENEKIVVENQLQELKIIKWRD